MKKELKKMAVALLVGTGYMWFLLSFGLCADEMGTVEKVAGMVYFVVMVPLYVWLKRVVGAE